MQDPDFVPHPATAEAGERLNREETQVRGGEKLVELGAPFLLLLLQRFPLLQLHLQAKTLPCV
jgi:hypothetical protein